MGWVTDPRRSKRAVPGSCFPGAGRGTREGDVLRVPGGARLAFQLAPDHRPPEWPRADRNSQQEHLDFEVTDMEAAQREVLALGATPLDVDDDGGKRGFRVFADPAGHPFCLCDEG
ncbi:VOC family protein [Streptomyces sp. NPDC056010]|uniref:VOC family protein n=1 Tax=Streptomyces sp. NPDC056010 TaxID=3345679 RepID=UPI0035D8635B